MKQLLEYIIPNIVNHPEEVEINETTDAGNVNLTIKVNPEDTGRVIGKAGKVIKAIRQIARVMAIKQGVRVNIEVLDGTTEGRASTQDTPSGEEMALEEGSDALIEEGTAPTPEAEVEVQTQTQEETTQEETVKEE